MTIEILENTTTESILVDHQSSADFASHVINTLSGYSSALRNLDLGICVFGIIQNVLVIDASRRNPHQTAGAFWMKYLGFWDLMVLLLAVIHSGWVESENIKIFVSLNYSL